MAFEPVKLDEAKRAELEAKHEDILVITGGPKAPWLVVLRRPTRKEVVGYKREHKTNEEEAGEQFIKRVCVFPDKDTLEAQIERWPFFIDGVTAAKVFKEFVGAEVVEQVKT